MRHDFVAINGVFCGGSGWLYFLVEGAAFVLRNTATDPSLLPSSFVGLCALLSLLAIPLGFFGFARGISPRMAIIGASLGAAFIAFLVVGLVWDYATYTSDSGSRD